MAKNRLPTAVNVPLSSELASKLVAFAEANFETPTEIARQRLAASFEDGAATEPADDNPNSQAALKQRRLAADVEERERKNAEARGELVRVEAVKLAYEKMITPIRQAIQQVGGAVDGLTEEQAAQLTKWTEDTLTNLSASNEPWN